MDCCTTTIRKLRDEIGIIQEETFPWISMPVNKRIKQLRDRLQSIVSFYTGINSDSIKKMEEYEEKVKLWCELLRET
ncbi:hypothetical protein ECA02_33820 [Enterococcus casseliflavus]|nr:hypothetical protein ECA02_33820 [Enterococcus casseliflavus]